MELLQKMNLTVREKELERTQTKYDVLSMNIQYLNDILKRYTILATDPYYIVFGK